MFIAALFVGSASAIDYVNVIKTRRLNKHKRALRNKNAAVEEEDVAFWTRLLKEGNVGSLPVGSSPPVTSVSRDPRMRFLCTDICLTSHRPFIAYD